MAPLRSRQLAAAAAAAAIATGATLCFCLFIVLVAAAGRLRRECSVPLAAVRPSGVPLGPNCDASTRRRRLWNMWPTTHAASTTSDRARVLDDGGIAASLERVEQSGAWIDGHGKEADELGQGVLEEREQESSTTIGAKTARLAFLILSDGHDVGRLHLLLPEIYHPDNIYLVHVDAKTPPDKVSPGSKAVDSTATAVLVKSSINDASFIRQTEIYAREETLAKNICFCSTLRTHR